MPWVRIFWVALVVALPVAQLIIGENVRQWTIEWRNKRNKRKKK